MVVLPLVRGVPEMVVTVPGRPVKETVKTVVSVLSISFPYKSMTTGTFLTAYSEVMIARSERMK